MKKTIKIIGVVLVILFVIGAISAIFDNGDKSGAENTEASASESKSEGVKSKWVYSEQTDQMDGTKTIFATLKSANKIKFEFPYDGGSTFQFIVRKTNEQRDFVLMVDKGQFMSNLMNNESLRIRFDENEVFTWSFSDAADASTNVIFPIYDDRFLAGLKNSKKMMIEAPFAFAGRQVIQFNTEGLSADF